MQKWVLFVVVAESRQAALVGLPTMDMGRERESGRRWSHSVFPLPLGMIERADTWEQCTGQEWVHATINAFDLIEVSHPARTASIQFQ